MRKSAVHPFDYKVVPKCVCCGKRVGWRIEVSRDKRPVCYCNNVVGKAGTYPHKQDHPYCDKNPLGEYNQLIRAGWSHYEIATETDVTLPQAGNDRLQWGTI